MANISDGPSEAPSRGMIAPPAWLEMTMFVLACGLALTGGLVLFGMAAALTVAAVKFVVVPLVMLGVQLVDSLIGIIYGLL